MTTLLQRIGALEAAKRRADLDSLATKLAAQIVVTVDELMAEAQRIANATKGMTADERLAWAAADIGVPLGELNATADRLLED